ncbi:hypothetical protein QJS04_geneDACA000196 [Acorus gramineus]|uniref:Uncharacterized protein n=1 Tax=Acorus gramineus TaxID=55184 RepID=A0AAV9AQH3_ACOGR|nr:hypothetical protein QJS04_geneDACA000196 [Acorus gramineus]
MKHGLGRSVEQSQSRKTCTLRNLEQGVHLGGKVTSSFSRKSGQRDMKLEGLHY